MLEPTPAAKFDAFVMPQTAYVPPPNVDETLEKIRLETEKFFGTKATCVIEEDYEIPDYRYPVFEVKATYVPVETNRRRMDWYQHIRGLAASLPFCPRLSFDFS